MHSAVQKELEENVALLLAGSSSHFDVLKATIGILAAKQPEFALHIIEQINTTERRDQAYYDLATEMQKNPAASLDFRILLDIIKKRTSGETKWQILSDLFATIYGQRETLDSKILLEIQPFVPMIEEIGNSFMRCRVSCLAYALLSVVDKTEQYLLIRNQLHKVMDQSLEAIEPTWAKIDAGNQIALNLAPIEKQKAKEYLNNAKSIADSQAIEAEKSIECFIATLKLAIRSYCGLASHHMETKEQITTIGYLINLVPSIGEQVGLWAILALLSYAAKRKDILEIIVQKQIWPVINQFPLGEQQYRASVLKRVAPALFYCHQSRAFEILKTLSPGDLEMALYQICDYTFTKTPWSEPFEFKSPTSFALAYEEILDICNVIEMLNSDYYIYSIIQNLVESLISRVNKYTITEDQRQNIKNRLRKVVEQKLPDKNNIRHEGYKIIAEAQLMRLEKTNYSKWVSILNRIDLINNIADQAYVYAVVACCIPISNVELKNLRINCIDNSIKKAKTIPSVIDRVDHYIDIAETIEMIDEPTSRSTLREAMKTAVTVDDPEGIYTKQRQIIDVAYKISKDFAEELANYFDCDPARMQARMDTVLEEPKKIMARFDLHQHLKSLKSKEALIKGEDSAKSDEDSEGIDPQEIWKTLASLNADYMNPFRLEDISKYLGQASKLPLRRSFAIYLWWVVNGVKRIQDSPNTQSIIGSIFESSVALSYFTLQINAKTKEQLKHFQKLNKSNELQTEVVTVVDIRNVDEVKEFLRLWLSQHLGESLLISDPYFTQEDLWLLNIVLSERADCKVTIVTGEKCIDNMSRPDLAFGSEWKRVSDQNPPDTNVIVVSSDNVGVSPIHDRFWLSNGCGLSFGTSANAIGGHRISQIASMSIDQYEKWSLQLDPFVRFQKIVDGIPIKYLTFQL
jgi:hypothetical protein